MHITRIPAHRRQRPQPVSAARHLSYACPLDPAEQFAPISLGTVYPEAALMCAVLEDALLCFRKQIEIESPDIERTAREAEEWFFSDDSRRLFSFVSVCDALGLQPQFIRMKLRHLTPIPPRHKEKKRSADTPGNESNQINAAVGWEMNDAWSCDDSIKSGGPEYEERNESPGRKSTVRRASE